MISIDAHGNTSSIKLRAFTKEYEVDRLLYWFSFDDVRNAIEREKQLKGWRREKKIALIESMNPGWEDLSREWYDTPSLRRWHLIGEEGSGIG